MESRVDAITPEIFRIAVWPGKASMTFNQFVGYIPAGPHVSTILARLRQLPITCLATMHGSTLCGTHVNTLCTALERAGGTQAGN